MAPAGPGLASTSRSPSDNDGPCATHADRAQRADTGRVLGIPIAEKVGHFVDDDASLMDDCHVVEPVLGYEKLETEVLLNALEDLDMVLIAW